MQCPQCGAEQPLWAQFCMQCGARQFRVPAPGPPGDVAPPRRPGATVIAGPHPAGAPAPLPVPETPPAPMVGVTDFRPHITVGYLLAFIATLVLPPLFGGIAIALGWLAYTRGAGHQKRQGLYVIAAGVAATAVGLAVAFWIQDAGLLA